MKTKLISIFFCLKTKSRLTKEVDDAVVVTGKEADQIAEEEQEGRVDNSISQIVGRAVKLQKGINLALESR